MTTTMKTLARDQKGQALLLAVILLLVGGLIAAPLLAYMGTGILTGEVYETRTAELYAADAGVEDAVWRIQRQVDVPTGCSNDTTRSYNITDVNGKEVDFTITRANNITLTYHVVSTATGDGSGTKIDAYVTPISGDFSGILDHVAISQADIKPQGPTTFEPPEGEHGPLEYYEGTWPKAEDLSAWYLQDVGNATHYYSDTTIDLKGANNSSGPLYVGGNLIIKNSSSTAANLTLTGTLYITGDTEIYGPSSNEPYKLTLDLNGQTIFVASSHTKEKDSTYALDIFKCNIVGSGCIIAVGDIQFKPKLMSSRTDYVLVMSIEGKTYMQPNGDFYGTLAGSSEVWIQNGDAHWTDYHDVEGGLNFPGFSEAKKVYYGIASWEVTPL